jgi:DNA-binding GntR family transcriptional regulator
MELLMEGNNTSKIININYAKSETKSKLSDYVKTSLVDLVADKIRTNIYSGKYPAGRKLIVRELSEEFDVSHTPVKDALNRLIAEGYIEALPRRSMVVRSFTYVELIEKLEVRLMCEIFYAEEIIAYAQQHPEVIEEMQSILAKMQKDLQDSTQINYEAWVKSEVKFHFCYLQGCRNKQMLDLYGKLQTNRVTYLAYLGTSHAPLKYSTLKNNFAEHQVILQAIIAGDTKKFLCGVIQHIHRACDDYAMDDECVTKIEHLKRLTSKYMN